MKRTEYSKGVDMKRTEVLNIRVRKELKEVFKELYPLMTVANGFEELLKDYIELELRSLFFDNEELSNNYAICKGVKGLERTKLDLEKELEEIRVRMANLNSIIWGQR